MQEALQDASKLEKLSILYLTLSRGLRFGSICPTPDYDIAMTNKEREAMTFATYMDEAETDEYLSIEIKDLGSPSGISTTKAQYVMFIFCTLRIDNVWIISVDKLKSTIKSNIRTLKRETVSGREYVIMPKTSYRRMFDVDTMRLSAIEVKK